MIIYILGAFLLSLLCGGISTPLVLDFCKRKRLYDIPNERKVHKNATPRLGGITFFPSMLIAFITVLWFSPAIVQDTLSITVWSALFMMGLVIMYFTGIIDDLVGLNATTKFTVQIITACLLTSGGLYFNNLYGLFGIYEIPYYIGLPLTIFMIVFIDNAINLIDGIDGLAASLSLLAMAGFLTYFVYYDVFMNTYSILIAGLMGTLMAFLYFNIYGKPERNTKIFMGDSGSLSLGFILGFLTVKCAASNDVIWPTTRPEAIIVPWTLLFVPMADVVRVTLHRLRFHTPLFRADKNHIHHKLMRAGLTQHQALGTILLLAIGFIVVNSLLYLVISPTFIIIVDILIYTIVNVIINRKTPHTA